VTELLTGDVAQDQCGVFPSCVPEAEAIGCAIRSRTRAWHVGSHTTTETVPALTRVLLDGIWSADRFLRLRESVSAHLYWEDGLWTCDCEDICVMGYGESQEAAIAAFMEDFFATYDGLVHEDDSSLTEDAKSVKKAMRRLVLASVPIRETVPGFLGAL